MKIAAERQSVQKKKSRFIPLSMIAAGAALASAFTVPGCPDTEALNNSITQMQSSLSSQDKKHNELVTQFRTINDEHNTMKQLINQVSESALAQKAQIEALQAEVKALNEKLARAPAPRAVAPVRSMPKPAPKPTKPAPVRPRR